VENEVTEKESPAGGYRTVFPILVAIGFCHFLNDMSDHQETRGRPGGKCHRIGLYE
jgi:hypothetical protein